MASSDKYWYVTDVATASIRIDCNLNPTDVSNTEAHWLWARNNKYDDEDEGGENVGKWMLFPSQAKVNEIWNKIKESIRTGDLWHSKVSTSSGKSSHAIMIYTKDYTDMQDVINVLDYLEKSGIKPWGTTIYYKTDAQTYAGVYAHKGQKASTYSSKTIKQEYEMKIKHKSS